MRTVINFLLVFSLAVGPAGLAHPTPPKAPSEAPNHIRVELTIPDPAKLPTATTPGLSRVADDELKKLMEEAHESMEGEEEEGNFAQRWIAKFNFYRIGLNAYRWYSVKRADPRTADQALNLVLMLLGSHTLETIGGSMLASSSVHDANPLVIAIKTILGIGITVPGLDPLCYALIAAYWRWPQTVNNALHYPRVAVVKSTSFLAKYSGMSAVMRWMWENKSSREWLEEKLKNAKPGTYVYEATVDGYDFHYATEQGSLKLTLKGDATGKLGVASVVHQGKVSSKAFSEWLTLFGWNVKDAVKEIATHADKGDAAEDLAKKVYTTKAEYHAGITSIETKRDALGVTSKSTFRPYRAVKNGIKRCDEWLDSLDKY